MYQLIVLFCVLIVLFYALVNCVVLCIVCLLAGSGCSILILLASSQHNLYDIYLLLYVQCQTPDDGQTNCSKYVEFFSKNKFEKLVHLVGFIIRIYHDARSSECQFCKLCIFIVVLMYSYCYVCSVLYILFHCVLCIVYA